MVPCKVHGYATFTLPTGAKYEGQQQPQHSRKSTAATAQSMQGGRMARRRAKDVKPLLKGQSTKASPLLSGVGYYLDLEKVCARILLCNRVLMRLLRS